MVCTLYMLFSLCCARRCGRMPFAVCGKRIEARPFLNLFSRSSMDKKSIRKRLLAHRDALPRGQVDALSRAAQQRLLADTVWKTAKQVVLYYPIRNEADTRKLLNRAWQEGKSVLLPRVDPERRGEMSLVLCHGEHELVRGTFGVREPDPVYCPALSPDDPAFSPDLAVIPGVGFDRKGNRLGFGAGYYDRYLSHPAMQRTKRVGLAYAFQVLEALPTDLWDTPMHALCTDKEMIWL